MKYLRHLITLLVLPGFLVACIGGQPDQVAINTTPDDESGLGGTGIIGTITGFGSIFVNGAEVEIDHHTQLSVDGRKVAAYTFARGEVVEILATGSGLMQARQLEVRHEVIGPVEQVEAETGQFRVLGQTVKRTGTSGKLPKPGDRVKVSGFRNDAGMIYATHIAPAGKTQALITGVITRTHSGIFHIGEQSILLRNGSAVRPGTTIRVSGKVQHGVLNADRVTTLNSLPFSHAVHRLLVQGFIHTLPGQDYRIDHIPLDLPAKTSSVLPLAGKTTPLRLEMQRRAGSRHWIPVRVISDTGLPVGKPYPALRGGSPRRSPGMPSMPMGGMPGMGGMGGMRGR